jgi:hypothetical protein
MAVVLLPNVEGLVSTFLQDDPDQQLVTGDRCYTALPKDKTYPLLRVTQIDDQKVTQRPLWVVTTLLQVEAWGDNQWDAWRAAATAQSVLAARLEGVHSRGVVTGVRFSGLRNVPDPDFTPAKPRRIFTCQVTAHPLPG